MSVKLNDNMVLDNYSKPYIVAEVNTSHFGDISKAKEMILTLKGLGCDCVKFQSWTADTLYSESYFKENPIAKRFFTKFSFDSVELKELSDFSRQNEISFASTPYSTEEVDFLADVCDVPFLKVASMDINNLNFLKYIAGKNKPIILSTGMSSFEEIDQAVETIENCGNSDICILHCVSIYPTAEEDINLNNILGLRERYSSYPIGFSDHTSSIEAAIASVALGAAVVEKHFTLDSSKIGMDNQMALESEDMSKLVEYCQSTHISLGSTSRRVSEKEEIQKKEMRRSLIATRKINKGDIIKQEDLSSKRPGTGIPPPKMDLLIGKVCDRDILEGELIPSEMLET